MTSAHTNHQIIEKNGEPLFVLIPYDEYVRTFSEKRRPAIPHAVVGKHIMEGKSLIRAWREYKRLTQREVAAAMGVAQATFASMEKSGANPRRSSLEKIAVAMGLRVEQLIEE